MKVYRIQRSFYDHINHIEATHGGFVKTSCVKWVARMGSVLEEVTANKVGKDHQVVELTESVEDKTDEDKSVPRPVRPKVTR